MVVGQGTTFIFPNTATPPTVFPPFPAAAAENGLSVDPVTGAIVLGQDPGAVGNPAQFLSAREIPMMLFDFEMWLNDNTDPFRALSFRQVGGHTVGNIGGVVPPLGNDGFNMNWDVDNAGAGWSANLSGFTANTVLTLSMQDNGGAVADLRALYDNGGGNQRALFLDWANQIFHLGDSNDFANGNKLSIDDANQRWEIGQVATLTNLLINFPTAGIGLSFFDSLGNNPFLLPDPGIGGIAFMSAPDFATQVALSDAGNGRLAQLGNVGASNNGNVFTVDDVNGLFIVTNTALNAAMQINGVAGFTGVVAPVNTITVNGGIVTNVA